MHPVEFISATKQYDTLTALSELNLTIKSGECIVLLGPNGAGKTTAIRLLLGLIHPTSGSISLFGKSPGDASSRMKVGYLPGELGWPLGVSCGEWLDFLTSLSGRANPILREHLLNRLAFPQSRLKSYIGTLSQGMKRKLGLVAAMEPEPELLVLDEPGDGLDPVQQRILDELLCESKSSASMLVSTHDLREAYAIADRIVIFAQGQLVDQFPRSEISSVDELEKRFFARMPK